MAQASLPGLSVVMVAADVGLRGVERDLHGRPWEAEPHRSQRPAEDQDVQHYRLDGLGGSSSADETMTDGTNPTEVSQANGPVRLIAVAAERGDTVSCHIVDGQDTDEDTSHNYGDIVTCTRTIRS